MSDFVHYDDVPPALSEHWACAIADVLKLVDVSSTDGDLRRSLKWFLALHGILLRLPPRGVRRGRSILCCRFQAWAEGDLHSLVRWWLQDKAAAHHRLRSRHRTEQSDEVAEAGRALCFLADGDVSRALKLLTSTGLADVSDERIIEQTARCQAPAAQRVFAL